MCFIKHNLNSLISLPLYLLQIYLLEKYWEILLCFKPLQNYYFMYKFHVLLCISFYNSSNNQNGSQVADILGFYTFF